MKLGYKFAFLMFGFAVTFLVATQGFVYFNTRALALEKTHAEMRQLANEIADHVDVLLREKVKMIGAIAAAPIIRAALEHSNAEYTVLSGQEAAAFFKVVVASAVFIMPLFGNPLPIDPGST